MPSHTNSESSTLTLRLRPPMKTALASVREKSALLSVQRSVPSKFTAPAGRSPQSPPLGTTHGSM